MFNLILMAALMVSLLYFLIQIRRSAKENGREEAIKRNLSSICFYIMAIILLVAMVFDLLGVVVWGLGLILLILAAYFTKYIPKRDLKE
ncbi:hypothetical protein LGQ02_15335 [Bacillus shivajii]|uniref:hypothetical protein n=1 Tax=Bacillus shivajii TaxID=1983719 RepID=UPI001CFAE731|nr:hypothetical protein [Bacillus shivajii]UCZ52207.1 hypothetical protein LGQ02_15335 [Bacillus shivajii]